MKATMREAQKEVMGDKVSMPNDIMPGEGEPEDIDGIKIYEIGLRHKTAMEAEQAVELTFSQNDYESQRRQTLQDLFDYGVSAYKNDTLCTVVVLVVRTK